MCVCALEHTCASAFESACVNVHECVHVHVDKRVSLYLRVCTCVSCVSACAGLALHVRLRVYMRISGSVSNVAKGGWVSGCWGVGWRQKRNENYEQNRWAGLGSEPEVRAECPQEKDVEIRRKSPSLFSL